MMSRLVTVLLFCLLASLVASCERSGVEARSSAPVQKLAQKSAEAPALAFALRGDLEAKTTFVLLHGYGAAGEDLVPLADQLSRSLKMRFVVPAAPLAQGRGRKWFSLGDIKEREASDALLSDLIAAEKKRGAERVVVGGFSQGAMMSLHAGALNDVDALVLWSGAPSPLVASKGERLKGLPVFVAHGTEDKVLPFAKGEALRDDLKAAGAEVRFFSFKGGHTIRPALLESLKFLQRLGFLESKALGAY